MHSTRRWLGRILLAASLALVVGGCGGGGDDPSDDASPDTASEATDPGGGGNGGGSDCPLTDEQVSTAVGHGMSRLDGTCSWEATDLEGSVLGVYYSGTDESHLAGSTGEEVAGVGDEARFDSSDALVVRVGDVYFFVQVLAIGVTFDLDTHAAAAELATIVADELA